MWVDWWRALRRRDEEPEGREIVSTTADDPLYALTTAPGPPRTDPWERSEPVAWSNVREPLWAPKRCPRSEYCSARGEHDGPCWVGCDEIRYYGGRVLDTRPEALGVRRENHMSTEAKEPKA